MKGTIEKRKPQGVLDHIALAITTCGVGYIPGAPGTYGSVLGVGAYLLIDYWVTYYILGTHVCFGILCGSSEFAVAFVRAFLIVAYALFCLIGIWASSRSTALLGDNDPNQAVVDEVMGQLIVFFFVPFDLGWPMVIAGFALFRLFDIWKPFPIDHLQDLSGGLGICADDIVAGIYAGICLAIGYAVYLSI